MRLGLNGWPPLLSHSLALVLGSCLSHLVISSQVEQRPFLDKHAFIPLSQSHFEGDLTPSLVGKKLYLGQVAEGVSPCLFKLKPVILLQVDPFPMMTVAPSEILSVAEILKKSKKKKLKFFSLESSQTLHLCKAFKERISYGL